MVSVRESRLHRRCNVEYGDNTKLVQEIESTILRLEEANELVVRSETPHRLANAIVKTISQLVPDTGLSLLEMYGVRALILEAVSKPSFFDWEMPTLTGFSKEQFEEIANKLPFE